jgi:hypothetical protein
VLTLNNEEEVRSRLVTVWLRDHGFTEADFDIERGFEYQIGRDRPRRPRCDFLVRDLHGRNLMVIEVKAPGEPVGDEAFRQALSYARMIPRGGFPPFVVLTNGEKSVLYDTVAEAPLAEEHIPIEHPFVRHPVTLGAEDIGVRAEALRLLISSSPENLLSFCRSQCGRRMRPLRSEDPATGKKYVPKLYVQRTAEKDLRDKLDTQNRAVTLLVGPPQVGKTNLVCATVERRLELGQPTLFFPAIGLEHGLLAAIRTDFCAFFNDAGDVHHALRRLGAVASKSGERMVVFIDGWNELQHDLAHALDAESASLEDAGIALVLSLTDLASQRLLTDGAGNPTTISEAAGVDARGAARLQMGDSIPERWGVVRVPPYSGEEQFAAYRVYASHFEVNVPPHHVRTHDPLLLRLGMEFFKGGTLPIQLDEPELLAYSIREKGGRRTLLREGLVDLLAAAGAALFEEGAPAARSCLNAAWRTGPDSLVAPQLAEVALLALMEDEFGMPAADFYYSRERDYVISMWTRQWPRQLATDVARLNVEWAVASRHTVGSDALRWYLRTAAGLPLLRAAGQAFASLAEPALRRVVIEALRAKPEAHPMEWVREVVQLALVDTDWTVRLSGCQVLLEDDQLDDSLAEWVAGDRDVIAGLVSPEDGYDLQFEDVGSDVLRALQRLHGYELDEASGLTDTLFSLLNHPNRAVRLGAAQALGAVAPYTYLAHATSRIRECRSAGTVFDPENEYAAGLRPANAEIGEMLYGSMCPGLLDAIDDDPELHAHEFARLYEISALVIGRYSPDPDAVELAGHLAALRPLRTDLGKDGEDEPLAFDCLHPDQLNLDLGSQPFLLADADFDP